MLFTVCLIRKYNYTAMLIFIKVRSILLDLEWDAIFDKSIL